jgi:hypothetical protein
MQISSSILRLALLRIFAEAGARGGLSFPEISQHWRGTGLRDADLRYAVHELMESGDLQCREEEGLLHFTLGSDAQLGLHHAQGELQLATLDQESTLLKARFRARPGIDHNPRRRLDDSLD